MRNWNKTKRHLAPRKLTDCQPTYEELKLEKAYTSAFKNIDCQPTYEELKRCPNCGKGKGESIASLPMRNWNSIRISGLIAEFEIASLPMRNWNVSLPETLILRLLNCQPTYEELKLKEKARFCDCEADCQPTYEELKPLFKTKFYRFIKNCQPTYEELKLF